VFSIFFGALALALMFYAWAYLPMIGMRAIIPMLVSLAAQFVLALVILRLLFVVAISDEGIVLYRVNRLSWSNIVTVRRVSVLGLPYLRITRKTGFR
jgi:hypothetical protein